MLKTATEIISESFQLYVKNWRKFVPFVLILFIPYLVLSSLGTIFLYLEVLFPASSLSTNIIIIILLLASGFLGIWTSIGLTKTIYFTLTDQPTNWKTDFYSSKSLILSNIVALALVFLIIAGPSILLSIIGVKFGIWWLIFIGLFWLIFPGIILTVWYNFVYYTNVLENKRNISSLNSSKALVIGRWWAITWRLVAPWFIFSIIGIPLSIGTSIIIGLLPLPVFLVATLSSLIATLLSCITLPLFTSANVILYKSAKENTIEPTLPPTPPKI